MLVLNRKSDQEIVLGGNVVVKVLSIKGNTVRIGIEAPGEVSILRGELVTHPSEPLEPVSITQATTAPMSDSPVCS